MPEATPAGRFSRLPRDGERLNGFSRAFIYKLNREHPDKGLIKKVLDASVLDLVVLDEIIASGPTELRPRGKNAKERAANAP